MWITGIILVILLLLDQISKYLSQLFLNSSTENVVISNFLSLKLEYNTGAAWSMGDNNTWLLVIISILGTILLGYFCLKNDWKRAKIKSFAVTMALAGCMGNLFDRFITITPLKSGRNGVVDMIVLKPFDFICEKLGLGTTVFNVADMFLVIGLIVFAIDMIFFEDRRKKKYGKASN